MESGKKILMGMTLDELTATARTLGLPSFVGKQMAGWLYDKHVTAIADMATYPKQTVHGLKRRTPWEPWSRQKGWNQRTVR